jgi:hypothetical protein
VSPETAGVGEAEGSAAADRHAWLEVLTAMEYAVAEVRRAGASGTEPATWSAPADIGPLPEDLRERATRLLAEQEAAMAELRSAQRVNRSHSAVLRALPHRAGKTSVYLDVEG